jgi:parvulin-like peptidyl-prolyl isomerase
MLPQLAIEEMVKLVAPQPPYRITVSDADIDAALASMAVGGAGEPTENEFSEWFRQQLNESGLGDAEYRELVRVRLLARALSDHLAARVPTVAEQVRLQLIMQTTLSDANAARARLASGEDFASLATELNADEKLKASAGELGWFPRAALASALARTAFDELQVGEVSGAVPVGANRFAIVKVAERRDAMPIDETVLQSVKSRALDAWAAQELKRHRVEYRGFDGGYNSETDAWVMRQLGHTGPE